MARAKQSKLFTVISRAFAAATRSELYLNLNAETTAACSALGAAQHAEIEALKAKHIEEAHALQASRASLQREQMEDFDRQRIIDVTQSVGSYIASGVRVPQELLSELSDSQYNSVRVPQAPAPRPGGKAHAAKAFRDTPVSAPTAPYPVYPAGYNANTY